MHLWSEAVDRFSILQRLVCVCVCVCVCPLVAQQLVPLTGRQESGRPLESLPKKGLEFGL